MCSALHCFLGFACSKLHVCVIHLEHFIQFIHFVRGQRGLQRLPARYIPTKYYIMPSDKFRPSQVDHISQNAITAGALSGRYSQHITTYHTFTSCVPKTLHIKYIQNHLFISRFFSSSKYSTPDPKLHFHLDEVNGRIQQGRCCNRTSQQGACNGLTL